MITAFLWPGTILETLDCAMYDVRVTPTGARMAAVESLIARLHTPTLWRKLYEVVWLGHGNWCVRMAWALELEPSPEVPRL